MLLFYLLYLFCCIVCLNTTIFYLFLKCKKKARKAVLHVSNRKYILGAKEVKQRAFMPFILPVKCEFSGFIFKWGLKADSKYYAKRASKTGRRGWSATAANLLCMLTVPMFV